MDKLNRYIKQLDNNIVRVAYTYDDNEPADSRLIDENYTATTADQKKVTYTESCIDFLMDDKVVLSQTVADLIPKEVTRCEIDGEPKFGKKLTANGEVTYIENAEYCFEKMSYSGHLQFVVGTDELLLGLGQYEDGVYDYRNKTEYLYESNMRIAMPFLITTGGYGIFIDTESSMIFKSNENLVEFEIDTTDSLVFYVILADTIPDIIYHFQKLTGYAAMLPRWAYGYVQSKERYNNADELTDTVKEFRDRKIPIDCIVQDWYSWEDGLWGEKIFDKKRYPNMPKTVNKLHDMNVKLMLSIWPNMTPEGENCREFAQINGLLPNSNIYDAFDEKCRKLYWKQCEREIMSAQTDALWCDNSEPFSDPDWNGAVRRDEALRYELVVNGSKKSMNWDRLNSYGLYHAIGIYENWRKKIPNKRVVNLTRSGYISGQKYGAILWSGDICARWDVMHNQITEGLKMGLCGNPYWTLDIGAFFTVKDKYENRGCNNACFDPLWFWNGDFNDGVKDAGYRELYTRWLQFGTFLPMFRSHGTDTPREPWNFINDDGVDIPFYETILKFINLRYQLIPYIYSLAYRAHTDAYIMMRSLVFDFATDKRALCEKDEYMFGDAFLVSPVTRPMYFGPNSTPITDTSKTVSVYLPITEGWYDYWTNRFYEGGQETETDAPIEIMPLFVKAGSIIPMSDKIEYADEKNGEFSILNIYEGADGIFDIYNDDGDGYNYEKGEYSKVRVVYKNADARVILEQSEGKMTIDWQFLIRLIRKDSSIIEKEVSYDGHILEINM